MTAIRGKAEFVLHAWMDESMRQPTETDRGAYFLAAVICDPTACDDVRALLRSLRCQKQPRLHWREEAGAMLGGQPEVAKWKIACCTACDQPVRAPACGWPGPACRGNRREGRGMSAITFWSREAMDRSRERGRGDARRIHPSVGVEVTEVDLVLAHLCGPETV